MLEKLIGFFKNNETPKIDRQVSEHMSDDVLFRMALFTGSSLESYVPMTFRLSYKGQEYEVSVDKDMKADVKRLTSY